MQPEECQGILDDFCLAKEEKWSCTEVCIESHLE